VYHFTNKWAKNGDALEKRKTLPIHSRTHSNTFQWLLKSFQRAAYQYKFFFNQLHTQQHVVVAAFAFF